MYRKSKESEVTVKSFDNVLNNELKMKKEPLQLHKGGNTSKEIEIDLLDEEIEDFFVKTISAMKKEADDDPRRIKRAALIIGFDDKNQSNYDFSYASINYPIEKLIHIIEKIRFKMFCDDTFESV